jgi:acetyl esterase/lipase
MKQLPLVVLLAAWTVVPVVDCRAETRIVREISYKPDATDAYERERCVFDLYLPEDSKAFATLIWFHGGGLQNGHKADDIASSTAQRFARDGIAVASINYRLSPKAKYPAYIEDAAAAVAFVRTHIGEYGGAQDKIFVSGHSAGGYLTLMVAMDEHYLAPYNLKPGDLAGYIPVSGQTVTHTTVRGERGIGRTTPVVDQAAPLNHVRKMTLPVLCIAGSDDLPARAEENIYFVAAAKAAGHQGVSYRQFADRDHGTIASRISEDNDPVAAAIMEFISSH